MPCGEEILDCIVIDLLGCAFPRASKSASHVGAGLDLSAPVARPAYSLFDVIAGCGTGFLLNLCITVVVPMALASAEARNHPSPLLGSGSVAATTSVGMSLSIVAMYSMPTRLLDGKAPFFAFAGLMLLGNAGFFAAEVLRLPLRVLVASRVLMALGFGAGFAAKRRAGAEADPRRREAHFMQLEMWNSLGMATGPLISGILAVALPEYAMLWPPALMACLALAFLALLAAVPLDAPLAIRFAPPTERSPLVTGAPAGVLIPASAERHASPSVAAASAEGATAARGAASAGGADGATGSGAPPRLASAVVVQLTMLLFGISRNFLKFGFESAMVVVYDRQFYFSQGASGVLAGCCALSTVLSMLSYRGICARRVSTQRLLLLAEALGLISAALMIATDSLHAPTVDLASAAGLTRRDAQGDGVMTAMLLTVAASMLFYPSMYLGAAIGNSHPLLYAIPGHPILSRSSMLAQQEVSVRAQHGALHSLAVLIVGAGCTS